MPLSWALVFALVCSLAAAGVAHVVDDAAKAKAPPERCWVDTARVACEGEVYSIRYIDAGRVWPIMVEGAEARDRVVAWLGR
jgi:hypothetical protein